MKPQQNFNQLSYKMNKVMTIFVIITFPLMFAQFKAAWDQFTPQTTSFAETDKEYRKVYLPSRNSQHANTCPLLLRGCHTVLYL